MEDSGVTEKQIRVINRIKMNILEFFEMQEKPMSSNEITKKHRGAVYKADLDWSDVDSMLKATGKVTYVYSKKNQKWFFPVKPDLTQETMLEWVELL